ncbi:MAG: carboxylate-amine ligase [Thermoleophilia bacterium]|nr:carboxylate-amine ligase [Thermoleophilia bacterium]
MTASAPRSRPRTALPTGGRSVLDHAFDTTDAFSLGGEEEFMLVCRENGELVPRATQVLAEYEGAYTGAVGSEVMASVVETATPICATPVELEASLGLHRQRLAESARAASCELVSAGTHPFTTAQQQVTEGERYASIAREYPWVVQEAATYGLHVHVGIQGADRAIAICNAFRSYLPHLLALSANSPFLRGEATGLQSTRVLLAQLYPRSGVPPVFHDFEDYARTIRALQVSHAVDDYTHTWWFCRPHPTFGTIEVRVCDAQTDVRRTAALAAMVQALAAWLNDELDGPGIPPAHHTVCEENLWSAARYGCDGSFIDEVEGCAVSSRRAIFELLHTLRPYLEHFGSGRYIPTLQTMIDTNGAKLQLLEHADDPDLPRLMRRLAARTLDPLAS